MIRRIIADVLALAGALFVISFGLRFLLTPADVAPTFGFAEWPAGEAADFLGVKGVRDLFGALLILVLLAIGERRALGWAMLCMALIPVGDGTLVLVHGGDAAAAFGVHYATAVGVAVTGLLQLSVAGRAEAAVLERR